MNRRKILLGLILAIVCGGVAGLSALRYLEQRPAALVASEPTDEGRPVAVATRDLSVGSVVRAEDVRLVSWPSEVVPEGYAGSAAEVVGRGVITEVRTNEALLESKLAEPGSGGGLPITIPAGMRAVSVRVDDVIGVAGFVLPGTRVDVIVTLTPPGSQDPAGRVILQNVHAVAAGQEIARNEEGEPMTVTVITLLVTPEDAERLVLAAAQGRVQMALRNTLDIDTLETPGSRVSALMTTRRIGTPSTSAPRSTPAPTPQAPPTVIDMYLGGVRTLISY
jgi:pilus assembly protein CpaB